MSGVVNKDALRKHLLNMWHKQGLETALSAARQFLKDSGKAAKKAGNDSLEALTTFRGELAEITLELILQEFMKRNPGSFYVKNLCIEKINKGGDSNYTELDVTLFTRQKVFMFECKAYAGEKTLIDECTIHRAGKEPMDIKGQSVAHLNHLKDYIDKYRKKDTKQLGYKIMFFDFSLDKTVDQREQKNKDRIVHCTDSDTLSKLEHLTAVESEVIWKIGNVLQVMQELDKRSANNIPKHLDMLEKSRIRREKAKQG